MSPLPAPATARSWWPSRSKSSATTESGSSPLGRFTAVSAPSVPSALVGMMWTRSGESAASSLVTTSDGRPLASGAPPPPEGAERSAEITAVGCRPAAKLWVAPKRSVGPGVGPGAGPGLGPGLGVPPPPFVTVTPPPFGAGVARAVPGRDDLHGPGGQLLGDGVLGDLDVDVGHARGARVTGGEGVRRGLVVDLAAGSTLLRLRALRRRVRGLVALEVPGQVRRAAAVAQRASVQRERDRLPGGDRARRRDGGRAALGDGRRMGGAPAAAVHSCHCDERNDRENAQVHEHLPWAGYDSARATYRTCGSSCFFLVRPRAGGSTPTVGMRSARRPRRSGVALKGAAPPAVGTAASANMVGAPFS